MAEQVKQVALMVVEEVGETLEPSSGVVSPWEDMSVFYCHHQPINMLCDAKQAVVPERDSVYQDNGSMTHNVTKQQQKQN